MTKPTIYVVAGPNGAGKTTFAMSYLNEYAGCREFINADLIAAGLSPFNPDSQAFVAGRLMLQRMDALSNQRESFAIETTLAGRGYARRLKRLKDELGYIIELIFVWLPNANFAIDRVANRVRQGGHSIPEQVIRRRFDQGTRNFAIHYAPIVDRWAILDGTWYPPRPIMTNEIERTMSCDASDMEKLQTHTPNFLPELTDRNSDSPNAFFVRLESAANECSQTIIDSAQRIPVPIIVWDDGETILINSITERRIRVDAKDDWTNQMK